MLMRDTIFSIVARGGHEAFAHFLRRINDHLHAIGGLFGERRHFVNEQLLFRAVSY